LFESDDLSRVNQIVQCMVNRMGLFVVSSG
jgi:hypothetical protein